MSETEHEQATVDWRKDVEDLGKRQSHTDVVIGELKVGQTALERGLSAVNQSVQALGQEFRAAIGGLRKDFPIATVFAGLAVCLSGAIWIGNLMTTPLRDQLERNTFIISALQKADTENAHWQGVMEGRWEERSKRIDSLEQASLADLQRHFDGIKSGAYSYGRQDAFEGRLDKLSERVTGLQDRTYNAKP